MTNQNHRNESENSNPGGFLAGLLLGGQDVVDEQKERWGPVVEAGKTAVR